MKSIPSSVPSRDFSAKENERAAAESIASLARGLRRAEGFTLFVAVCNRPAECDEMIRMLTEAMPGVTLHRVRVSPETKDLLAEVVDQVPDMTGPILITDIDRAVQWDSPRHGILETLNAQRRIGSDRFVSPWCFGPRNRYWRSWPVRPRISSTGAVTRSISQISPTSNSSSCEKSRCPGRPRCDH